MSVAPFAALRTRAAGLGAALLCAAVWLGAAGPARAAESPAPFPWPGGARAAVSLGYDDALDSQLDHAVPALDARGLHASFYLTLSSPTLRLRMADWRAVAARGHELGNHTLFHQCAHSLPGHEWVTPENDLDTTSAERLAAQIRLGNTLLQAIDGRRERTFTVPCGDLLAAGQPYLPLVAPEFVAIKAGDGDVVPDMRHLNPLAVGVLVPVDLTGDQLIAIVQRAARAGTLVNLTFHGIGGDYLSVSTEAHRALIDHLAAHPELYWTDTFLNIMKWVRAHPQ